MSTLRQNRLGRRRPEFSRIPSSILVASRLQVYFVHRFEIEIARYEYFSQGSYVYTQWIKRFHFAEKSDEKRLFFY